MHALVQTIAFRVIDTIPVDVQVYIANGLPTIAIVSLADKAGAESLECVEAAQAFAATQQNQGADCVTA